MGEREPLPQARERLIEAARGRQSRRGTMIRCSVSTGQGWRCRKVARVFLGCCPGARFCADCAEWLGWEQGDTGPCGVCLRASEGNSLPKLTAWLEASRAP